MNSPGSRTSAEDVMALNMTQLLRVAPFYLNIFFVKQKFPLSEKNPRKRALVLRNSESYCAFPRTDISLSCWLRREERMTTPTFRVYFDFELHAYLKNCESNRNLPLKYLNSRLKYTFCDRGFK